MTTLVEPSIISHRNYNLDIKQKKEARTIKVLINPAGG